MRGCRQRGAWRLWGALLVALLALSCAVPPEGPPARIVVVGDVHGGDQVLGRVLAAAGLVDAELRWSGGATTLVQLGDLLDRGPGDRAVMDLMMRLEHEARAAGGRVVVLLGNHEAMNLHGDLRYVAPESYAAFGGPDAERRREEAFEALIEVRDPSGAGQPIPDRATFLASHPPGYVEHREAFGPDGTYGRWLRQLPAVHRIGDIAFAHGGFHPDVAVLGLRGINERLRAEFQLFDATVADLRRRRWISPVGDIDAITASAKLALEHGRLSAPERQRFEQVRLYASWFSAHSKSPLWFRGFATWTDEELAQHLPGLQDTLGVRRFVVGHTPQPGGVRVRGGVVFLTDTGMLGEPFYPGGSGVALEIVEGRFAAIDEHGARTPLLSDPP